MLKVIERATGKVVGEWNLENVKSHADIDSLEKMRKNENHELSYFGIEFKGLEYGLAIYEVDKFDMMIA